MRPLKTIIEALRVELDEAVDAAAASRRKVKLKTEKISVTLQVVAEESKKANGGVSIYAATLGAEGSENYSQTHSLTLEFVPKIDSKRGPTDDGGDEKTILEKLTPKPKVSTQQGLDEAGFVLGDNYSAAEMRRLKLNVGLEKFDRLVRARRIMMGEQSGGVRIIRGSYLDDRFGVEARAMIRRKSHGNKDDEPLGSA